MKDIAIVGAGGFGREVKMLIEQINKNQNQFNFTGFYDDHIEGKKLNGAKYLGTIQDLLNKKTELLVAISIADPTLKREIVNLLQANKLISYPNLIHPQNLIGNDDVVMGKGNIICAGCIITVNVRLDDFIILNLGCTVGHDTHIHNYSSFMPSVNISGDVIVKEGVYVGTGAKISNQLNIGSYSIIGAGAVVSKDIPENCTAVGVPAKPIKFHQQHS